MFTKELFGQRLVEVRKRNGETQEDLGKELGVGKSQISQIESGSASTTVEKMAVICRHYNVSADYLLGLTDDPAPHSRKEPPHAP